MTEPSSSPHFDDFGPQLVDDLPGYGSDMAGEGRWFLMVAADNHLIGTLWTDDGDNLGLISTEQSSPAHVAQMWSMIRGAADAGLTATSAFDGLLQAYEPELYSEGSLPDLLDSLS